MQKIFHSAESRGKADLGWLLSYHTFSFSSYYDPSRIQFGALRVLNDDTVSSGMGFHTHAHENMEIVSIPLEGILGHKDSTGIDGEIHPGEVQIMSAGTGIRHSEMNLTPGGFVKFLQIWILPKKKNIEPRYDQKKFTLQANKFTTIVSPSSEPESVWINQDAYFQIGKFTSGFQCDFSPTIPNLGVYFFLMQGKLQCDNWELNPRDGLGISEYEKVSIRFLEDSFLLAIEVPV